MAKKRFKVSELDFYQFSSEKMLEELMLENIKMIMKKVFDEEVKSATNKKYEIVGNTELNTGQLLPRRGARLDLWVECKSGHKYIFEIKNPKEANYKSFKAIGQLLGYAVKFPKHTHLVLASTVYDEGIVDVLSKYNLPIDFVLITEKQIFLLEKNG